MTGALSYKYLLQKTITQTICWYNNAGTILYLSYSLSFAKQASGLFRQASN